MHRKAALEHDLEKRFEAEGPGDRGERGVLADGVAGEVGPVDEQTVLAELGDLRYGEARHRDLRELRQVENPVRVAVGGATNGHLGGVVAHYRENRKT